MSSFQFDCFISGNSLNGNAVAKYTNSRFVKLVHERDCEPVNSLIFTHSEWDRYKDDIAGRYDLLAFILTDLFDCKILKSVT
jgi:hypothetical protein